MNISNLPSILFKISNTAYGISCESVLSIVILNEITEIPKTPEYIRGVTNLRGKIIPLIDMRKFLGFNSN